MQAKCDSLDNHATCVARLSREYFFIVGRLLHSTIFGCGDKTLTFHVSSCYSALSRPNSAISRRSIFNSTSGLSTLINATGLAGRIMKVNHAGEHGAVSIYAGQIFMARFTARSLLPELLAFKADEEKHRSTFYRELQRRGLMRCKSYWLCAAGGYALGIGTGLFGAHAISLTTVAVERTVLRHLRHQTELLAEDVDAVSAISSILDDELEHHDTAANHNHTPGIFGRMLSSAISGATESVIWLGMRL